MVISDAQPIQFWLDRLETFNEKEVDGIFGRCFCQPFKADDEITMQFKDTTGLTRGLTIYDENGTLYSTTFSETASGYYQKTITPSSIGITNNKIQFRITDGLVTDLAKSDCISIKEYQKETVLINYHNNRIFVSLNSAIGTPDPEFNLRIPAIFFKERHPDTTETIKLSNSRMIENMSEIEFQKLLQIKNMPAYMHLKTKLALKFQNVVIDNVEWVARESYEVVDSSNPRWPMNKAQIWLNRKDYIVRNIL